MSDQQTTAINDQGDGAAIECGPEQDLADIVKRIPLAHLQDRSLQDAIERVRTAVKAPDAMVRVHHLLCTECASVIDSTLPDSGSRKRPASPASSGRSGDDA